jgi:hypothetical protein
MSRLANKLLFFYFIIKVHMHELWQEEAEATTTTKPALGEETQKGI